MVTMMSHMFLAAFLRCSTSLICGAKLMSEIEDVLLAVCRCEVSDEDSFEADTFSAVGYCTGVINAV